MSTSTAPTSTRDVVDAFFARFGEGDVPALLDLFDDGVDFEVAGSSNVPWAGSRTSKDEIAAFFASFGQHLTPAEEYVVATTVVDGDHAVIIGHNRFGVLATGKSFTNHFALHITAADGKITGYRMHEDSHAISEAFTS
ncbi:nuclear transport factor 2 family protein [Streptomyces sp. NPDC005953]|uniref:nuclear transport factor 2 family protein n=1 Tax=Streptomyces sp. NPDC005953 TaxID=3156719 RepID=UPI0033F20A26